MAPASMAAATTPKNRASTVCGLENNDGALLLSNLTIVQVRTVPVAVSYSSRRTSAR